MGCRGWPVRGLNDYIENWTAANSNWTYDGDESFSLYPGYLAVNPPAASTFAQFNPVVDFLPFPRVPTSPYPIRLWMKIRAICNAGLNVALASCTLMVDNTYTLDFVNPVFGFNNVTGNYQIEVFTQKGGVPGDVVYDTGIARVADGEFDLVVEVTGVSYTIWLNGVLVAFESGFTFSEIGFIEVGLQRQANKQGLINRTEIYTQAP